MPPDGSASNAAPALNRIQGTDSAPKKHFLVAAYDASTAEHLWWQFTMPVNFASAPIMRLLWMANAVTATAVVWGSKIGAVTPADTDTPVEHAMAAATTATTNINTTEARRLIETQITLANTDSVAANDLVFLLVYRVAGDGADTCAVDAELVSVSIDYTTT